MEYPNLFYNIKEENVDIEIKQEEISFELIEEEEESCLIDEIKEEISLQNDIKEEDDRKENNEICQMEMMEFINAEEQIDDVWTDPPGHEADPLALIPVIETKVEPHSTEEEHISTTDVCRSTSQNWLLPERIKGKLPAEMLGAVKPVKEWKCHICNEIEPNVATYARHLIVHFKILHLKKCSYCNMCRNGKHERTCKLFPFMQGLSDGSDLNEEDRRKANTLDGDELKGDDGGELVTQDQSKVQEESLKKKKNEASEVFACDICKKKSFRKLTYLVRHLRKHTGDFYCKFCKNIFARKETLLSHKCLSEINEEYRKVRCRICNVVLYSAMELSSHIAYHYCTYSKWECKHCRLISEDVEKLDKHFCLQSNGLKRQFSCDNCNKLFSTSTEFTEHREEVNIIKKKGVKENKTICEVCGIVMSKKTFKIHHNIHNGKRFECKECGMKFCRIDSLQIHKLKHSLPKFSCSVCEKKFKCKKNLDKHVLSHTKNHVLKFSCEHCNKKFNHKHHMLVHVQNHFRKFICDLCRKVFSSKISLKRHSIIHTHETTFQCTLCDRRFFKEKKMFAHRRKFHSADYTCHYCNVKIAYRQSLKRHLTSRHLNSKHEWDVEGALDSMKTTLNYTDEEQMEEENLSSDEQMQEENFEPSDEQMQEENFKASEPQAAEVVDRDGLPDLGNDVSTIQVADSQNLVTLSKERVLDLMNSTSNISVTDSQDLIAMSKERLFDLVNGTSNIPVTDSEDLITLSKERLLELLNGTSDVNTSQDLIELSKEGLLDLANGATDIPVTQAQELVGLNVDNITVNVLWTNVENEQLAESETLTTKNDSIVPMVQLTAPEELIGLNVDNSCIDNGIGTYILEDGRIMNEDVQLGGDISFYVVELTTDDPELLFL